MGWLFGDDRPAIDTRSERWKVCLHEAAHAVVAESLGWRVRRLVVHANNSGDIRTHVPAGLDDHDYAVQYASWLLAGPAASRRVCWFLPFGCGWDIHQARRALRRARVTDPTFRQIDARSRRLVASHWSVIQARARTLYS